MVKKTTILLLLLLCVGGIRAQFYIVPEIGTTAVHYNFPKPKGYGPYNARYTYLTEKWRAGWKPGIGIHFHPRSEKFAFQTGLYYTQRGYELTYLQSYPKDESFIVDDIRITRSYLQVPVLLRFSWKVTDNVRMFTAFGPYFAWMLGDEKRSYKGSRLGYKDYEVAVPEDPDDFDFGYGYWGQPPKWLYPYDIYDDYYGSGSTTPYRYNNDSKFDWGTSISLGVEYHRLAITASWDASFGKATTYDSPRLNYHTLSLSVGYKIKIGK